MKEINMYLKRRKDKIRREISHYNTVIHFCLYKRFRFGSLVMKIEMQYKTKEKLKLSLKE